MYLPLVAAPADCRWVACLFRAGLNPEPDPRRFLGMALARALVLRLPGTPVRIFRAASGRLRHPHGAEQAERIGEVLAAWLEGDRLMASFALAPAAAAIESWFVALEQRGRLREVGLSCALEGARFRDLTIMGRPAVEIVSFEGIAGLDVVSRPAAEDARLLRSERGETTDEP